MRVLDLGGSDGGFSELLQKRVPLDITVADVADHALACRRRGLDFVRLDGSPRLPFDDGAFDVVFCNSVIEHVTMSRQDCLRIDLPEVEWQQAAQQSQTQFANEIRRVGRGYFVQTPHRRFPVEQHTLLPFLNRMSHQTTQRVIRHTNRFWVRAQVADWRLLDDAEMQAFFPDATIEIERFLGVEKSIVAYRVQP